MGVRVTDRIVDATSAAIGRATAATPSLVAAPFWTDAALHAAAGVPAVVVGPVGAGLHEDLEWVTTQSLRQLTTVLEVLIERWCTAG